MIVHEPEVIRTGAEVRLQSRIETRWSGIGLPETLWFRYPQQYESMLSTRGDCMLSAVILIAMAMQEDLECRGDVSPRLYYNLDEYQKIFAHWRPDMFHPIEIRVKNLVQPPATGLNSSFVASFSGGVDSFFTIHQMKTATETTPHWPLKYLLFMQGSADLPLVYSEKYEHLVDRYSKVAQELNLDLIPVRTNLLQFAAKRVEIAFFLESPLAGAALGLHTMLSGILMGSGVRYERYKDSTTGPLTTYLLSTETFESISFGAAHTRLDKVRTIADWLPAQKNLRVCLGWTDGSAYNCSYCSKCLRTRMELNICGRLEDFPTLKSPFTLKDILLWGRWMEIGHGWEKDMLAYALFRRKNLVPSILLGILIGNIRNWLRKELPERLKKWIFRFTAEIDPHELFARNDGIRENGFDDHLNS